MSERLLRELEAALGITAHRGRPFAHLSDDEVRPAMDDAVQGLTVAGRPRPASASSPFADLSDDELMARYKEVTEALGLPWPPPLHPSPFPHT